MTNDTPRETEPPEYIPFDQDMKLPPPPWTAEQVEQWEAAHGHDVRLKCYAEFGCQVIEEYAYWRGFRDAKLNKPYNWTEA